ncbi:MAG: NAD-dependent epimerase/dehydratase family protein [Lachnospiraceae bacterium]|nr:NAD-dependent epimerase/dehydratase family protein [Lachnospiraceae bacterium]
MGYFLYDDPLYAEDIKKVADLALPWDRLSGACVFMSGAGGLLGSFLTDVLMQKNSDGLNVGIIGMTRDKNRLVGRFSKWTESPLLCFYEADVRKKADLEKDENAAELARGRDLFVLHLASNTHPVQYATDPIGTITTNITGLMNMLDFASENKAVRFAFASSNEIYGENRKDTELFTEDYCGYIDCNTLRAGYPESKRCGEALCQAYKSANGLDVVIPRFTRSYGPTMLMSDTKAISQFIRKGIAGEDIVLKSEGNQFYSYTYVADAISGLLYILLKGESGQAYNIADQASDITLKELAGLIADKAGSKVIFDLPDDVEKAGYSKATVARLSADKLKALGWKPFYDMDSGIKRTMDIFKNR